MVAFRRKLAEKLFLVGISLLSVLALLPLLHIVASLLVNGGKVLLDAGPRFLYDVLPPATATRVEGGIGPAIVGSLLTVLYASLIALPVSILVGVFIVEFPQSSLSSAVRSLIHLLTEFPTVMVGMFSFAVVVVPLGTYSMLAAAFALSLIMMPYVTSGTEEALRMVPSIYKEAGYALGLRRARVVLKLAMAMARRGVVTAVLIGVAKAAGETAALLFTAGRMFYNYPPPLPSEHLFQPVGLIPLLVYYFAASPYGVYREVAWGASLVLFLIFLALFISVRRVVKEVRM